MRVNSHTGFEKWTKAFYVKKITSLGDYLSIEITSNQVAWILFSSSGVYHVYRMSGNGTILQTILFGSINLNFVTNSADFSVISETEFFYTQDLSLQNGNMSVGPTTGTDFSIARISTDLSVK